MPICHSSFYSKSKISAVLAFLGIALPFPLVATPTENNGLRVLPAPSHVTIDGKDDDWDRSAGIFCCDDVENQRDNFGVWLHAMYDKDNLYILARFSDQTPLDNPGQVIADMGFAGDCLQFRIIAEPGTANEETTHWTCWRGHDQADIMTAQYGKDFKEPTLKDAKTKGAQQAFVINADGHGYVQEVAIPWKLLTKDGTPPAPGSDFRLTFEPNFTIGIKSRLTIKDLFQANMRPDRVFTFRAWPCWGTAKLETQPGPVAPQPVRLADAREFPVKMENGDPKIDWTGLVKNADLPGFKQISFTMPEDGYISLNIKAADGSVVRQLLNQAFYTKGPHEVKWDGLTNLNAHLPGQPVAAGDYTWSALFHQEIGLKFRGWANNAGSAPWDNGDSTNWGGDEGDPISSATDETQVYLGWSMSEAGGALLACDLDGNVKWKNKHGGIAGTRSLAASDGVVYILGGDAGGPPGSTPAEGGSIYKLRAKDGHYVPWSPGTEVDLAVKGLWGDGNNGPAKADFLAARSGKLYVGFTEADKILVLEGASGKLLQTLHVTSPGSMQVGPDGNLYVLSGGNSVLRVDASDAAKPLISGLTNAKALAVDSKGSVYVGVGDPDNQVKVFDNQGKPLQTIGRAGGRALLGKWTPDGVRFISSLSIGSDGKLWVVENDHVPRRISSWDVKTGALIKEFFGSTDYGATGGAISPLDPNVMVGQGCEWHLDPVTGHSTCVAVITREDMANSRFGVGDKNRLYLAVAPSRRPWMPDLSIFERTGDGVYALRSKFYYFGGTNPRKPTTTRYWTDINGDGQEQPEESTTVPGAIVFSGWYMAFAPDLTFYAGYQQFKVKGFTPAGAPLYDLSHPVAMPHADEQGGMGVVSGMGSADGRLVMYNGKYAADRSTFNVYDIASGKQVWSYPNNFVGVHGSHNATPPEAGMIRGAYDITGTAQLPEPIGNIWVIPTNVGEWHILTADGFYLTKLFQGDQLKQKWPAEAIPGADMSQVPPGIGGEDFGGSISYGRDGKLYFQAGKTAFWNLEVTGLETVRRLPGGKLEISAPEVAQAQALRESELQTVGGKRVLAIRKATPVLTGNLTGDFKGAEILSFEKSPEAAVQATANWDETNLYLAWNVTDNTPWQNSATVPEDMYVSGDTVDFQLGANPQSEKNRDEAVQGDLRISIGNFQGTPTAVLYRKVSETKKPKSFSSGVVHDYVMEEVRVLGDVKPIVKIRADGYIIEATIPWAALGLPSPSGLHLRGDFGATHGGPGGTRTRLRTYWNNQHTGLVDDAVFELKMEPKNWGELQFNP